MQTISKTNEMRNEIQRCKRQGKSIGFIPTMGCLHEGHLSLIRCAAAENDLVVVSIFVNPIQFGPGEDFEKYPRDIERDTKVAQSAGTDIIFTPRANEMYPEGFSAFVEVGASLTGVLCGRTRPGHFRGVTTVLAKLFNIITPDRAYFGQKDAQQAVVVETMVRELNFGTEIIVCPIVREADGLAMSSRNTYLSAGDREKALVLSRSLKEAEQIVRSGVRDAGQIKEHIINNIRAVEGAELDYVEAVNAQTLEVVDEIRGRVLVALAVKFGRTRLIDNTVLEV